MEQNMQVIEQNMQVIEQNLQVLGQKVQVLVKKVQVLENQLKDMGKITYLPPPVLHQKSRKSMAAPIFLDLHRHNLNLMAQ